MTVHVLTATDLVKDFPLRDGRAARTLRAVDAVSLELRPGETVALVGESGSGKSTVARMLAQLVAPTAGTIALAGQPLPRRTGHHSRALRQYREQVQIVFQDPFASLNPFHTVDHHLRRPLRIHRHAADRAEGTEQVHHLLERVGLVPPARVAGKRPHELSGGQRQRVAIARALAPRPRVLLADEPVSMLDVSIRLEILNLIDRLMIEDDLAVLYITHDLATARHFSARIMVLYRGQIVESGPSDEVILRPAHPYTQALANAAPDPRARRHAAPRPDPPPPVRPGPADGSGCLYRNRCPHRMPICDTPPPTVAVATPDHRARCWLHHG